MDNRPDRTEDLQATAEHPAGRVPGMALDPAASGLTAGPHNDPPPSHGVIDTSVAWRTNEFSPDGRRSSRMKAFTHTLNTNALPLLIGAVGLTTLLLSLRGARRH